MNTDHEKSIVQHVNRAIGEVCNDAGTEQFTPQEQKKIIRRIDRRLVMTLGLLYMCSLMDRTNVAIAKISGLHASLIILKSELTMFQNVEGS
jgi:hypothetical protein